MAPFDGEDRNSAANSTQEVYAIPGESGVEDLGELNVVVSVGKTLVHHRRYATQPRGVQVTMTPKSDLQKYLLSGNAVLVAE